MLNTYSVIISNYFDVEVFIKAKTEEEVRERVSRMYKGHRIIKVELNNSWWTKHYKGVCV